MRTDVLKISTIFYIEINADMANNESMIDFTCDGFLVYSSNGRVSRIPFNAHTDCAENGFSLKSSLERTGGETRMTLSVSAESHTHILAVECALP
ncbi:MAG TPA: hypothetical protein PK408_06190, partial [Treponemataceae bacterium]|nr:hypothetical protein [Treponemataceae bacterium]